jgi:hypothetical protein
LQVESDWGRLQEGIKKEYRISNYEYRMPKECILSIL